MDNVVEDKFKPRGKLAVSLSESVGAAKHEKEPNPLPVETDEVEDDSTPFDQIASQDLADNLEKSEQVPEEVRSKAVSQVRKHGMLVGGVIALLVLLITLGVVGYNSFDLGEQVSSHRSEITDMALEVEEGKTRDGLMQESLSQLSESVGSNKALINEVSGYRERLDRLEVLVGEIQEHLNHLDAKVGEGGRKIDDVGKRLDQVSGDLKLIKEKNKKHTRNVSARKVARKTKKQNQSIRIKGVSLAAIDWWGNSVSVVMRRSSGEWVAMRIGDSIDGWRLRSADGTEAKFTKGKHEIKLRVED